MNFKALKWVVLALGITLTTAYAADSEYWREFEARGVPLMRHIQDLSTVAATDSSYTKNRKKDALAYFFATGGKYGFRQEPPTASEYDILVKALAVTTALHYFKDAYVPVLDLVEVRRRYGLTTEDEVVRNHLIKAQAIIGYRPCIVNYLHPKVSAIRGQDLGACVPFASLESLFTKPKKSDLKSVIINGLTLPIFKIIASTIKPGRLDEADENDVKQIRFLLDVILPPKKQPLQVIVSDGEIYEYLGNRTWKSEKRIERSDATGYFLSTSAGIMQFDFDEEHFLIHLWKRKLYVQELIFPRAEFREASQLGGWPFDLQRLLTLP